MRIYSLTLFAIACLCLPKARAQYVTIPNASFRNWLQTHGYASCLNVDQLDTTCALVTNAQTIDCSSSAISGSLYGVQFFDNLDSLVCGFNSISNLPGLPASLVFLHCGSNSLTNLPSLPASLVSLHCFYNDITTLPPLPLTLEVLQCGSNPLSALPVLPNGLKQCGCNSLNLVNLPSLPDSLERLDCNGNDLVSLPSLPSKLDWLNSNNNPLTVLPDLPFGLGTLSCHDNLLQTLPDLPATLHYINCGLNQLTGMPALPDSLIELYCVANQLSSLPNLPNGLKKLYCAENLLSALPVLPHGLSVLSCGANQLTYLPPLPATLNQLMCPNNNLQSLPELPYSLSSFYVGPNPLLTCMPPLMEYTGNNLNFYIYNTGITCLPNAVQHSQYVEELEIFPVCDVINQNGCPIGWNIRGKVFLDSNADCLQNGDLGLHHAKVLLFRNDTLIQQAFTSASGIFTFQVPLDTYVVKIDTANLPYTVYCPFSNADTVILSTLALLDTTVDFAALCVSDPDLTICAAALSGGAFLPAQQATVSIDICNVGSVGASSCFLPTPGSVQVVCSGVATATVVSDNGTLSGDTVTWNVTNIFDLNNLSITFLSDSVLPVGSQVCIDIMVTAAGVTDNNPGNNHLYHCFPTASSFDPNFKEVAPAFVNAPGDWHTYTVHFQNTGTAPALNVLIRDTLDANLDWSSFQLLDYTHVNVTQVFGNGVVRFNFPNIMLPDSNVNEPESHGWIQYRIKTDSTLAPGTDVHNTASIYFDFNDPIVTNDAVVTFCAPIETQQSFSICQGDSIQIGSTFYHQAGTYTNAFNTTIGCDSIVTTTLSLLQPTEHTASVSICQGDSVQINGAWHSQPETFITLLANTSGCDSLITTTVDVLLHSSFEQSFVVCHGESVTVGSSTYTANGTFTDIFQNANGCDSIVQTTVEVETIDTSITTDGATLTATSNAAAYQWIDCNSNQPVAGATNPIFTATSNGNYAVELSYGNGCVTKSACANVTSIGIESIHQGVVNVYPNPSNGNVHFDLSNHQGVLTVYNAMGQVVESVRNQNALLTLTDLPQGLLTYRFVSDAGAVFSGKLAVQK